MDNSVYNPNANNFDHWLASVDFDSANVSIHNNVIYAVGHTDATKLIVGDTGQVNRSNNIGIFPNRPGECVDASGGQGVDSCIFAAIFTNTDFQSGSFLEPLAGGALIDSGANVELFEDFSQSSRPVDGDGLAGNQWDIGAFEFVP